LGLKKKFKITGKKLQANKAGEREGKKRKGE
jgi:hypothetical protein